MNLTAVHGKNTYECHTGDIRVHTSDIRMTYEYMRVTYGWHREHTSDIRMTYEWYTSDIRMTCEWHTDAIRVHTSHVQMTYEWYTSTYDWHVNYWRNIKLHNGFGALRLLFLTICVKNTALYSFKRFLSLGCSCSHTFCLNIPKFNYRFCKPE